MDVLSLAAIALILIPWSFVGYVVFKTTSSKEEKKFWFDDNRK